DGIRSFHVTGVQTCALPIYYKSREEREGDMLADLLAKHPGWRERVWGVYGGDEPTARAVSLIDDLKGMGAAAMKECLIRYLALEIGRASCRESDEMNVWCRM